MKFALFIAMMEEDARSLQGSLTGVRVKDFDRMNEIKKEKYQFKFYERYESEQCREYKPHHKKVFNLIYINGFQAATLITHDGV